MAASSYVKNFCDSSITLSDETGSPITLTVPLFMGDFAISGLKKALREVVAYQAQGVLTTVRYTNRTFPTFSFTAQMATFTSATATSLSDAILQNGAWASAISTLGTGTGVVYTLKVTHTIESSNFEGVADPSLVLDDCALELEFSDGDPSVFKISGTCYGAVTGDLAI